MKIVERNVIRLAAVQHLRTAHGIKTKNWNKNKASGCKLGDVGHSVSLLANVTLANLDSKMLNKLLRDKPATCESGGDRERVI